MANQIKGKGGGKQAQGDITAKKTSIQLGHAHKNGFVTMNSKQYTPHAVGKPVEATNKEFIKSHHFDIGSVRPRSLYETKNHYMSEAVLRFNNKGDPVKLRAKLDNAKKEDLRHNHFEIGGPTAHFS